MKYFLYAFGIAFSYRLLKNLCGFMRAKFYLHFWQGNNDVSIEAQPTISKIIYQADVYNYGCTKSGLQKAKGVFLSQIKENFSPFFWVETIWFLPSRILDGLGINTHRKTHKFIEYLLSAIGWIICFVISLFSDEIKTVLLSLF